MTLLTVKLASMPPNHNPMCFAAADMKVFIRERLNGYYGVSQFTVSNTLASLPFIFLIAVVSAWPVGTSSSSQHTCHATNAPLPQISSVCVYFIASLRMDGESVVYFILDLFISLVVVESLMMAIAPLVPHYLMGIAVGAGIMGLFMIVCGFFQPLDSMPGPVLRYPLSYLSYHTYAFTGAYYGRARLANPICLHEGKESAPTHRGQSQQPQECWLQPSIWPVPLWASVTCLLLPLLPLQGSWRMSSRAPAAGGAPQLRMACRHRTAAWTAPWC